MKINWSFWLEKTSYYRVLFMIVIGVYFYFEKNEFERDYVMPSIIAVLVLSALSFRKMWMQSLTSGLVTVIGTLHAPEFSWHMSIFQWTWSFVMAAFMMVVIEKYLNEKRNMIDLVTSLANTLDSRDAYTAFHSENVADYSKKIAQELKLSSLVCENIYLGGQLHDIGKVGIPETILNKTTRLTDEEFAMIKEHPLMGYKLVKHIKVFEKNGIHDMIKHHHEHFDGRGYPSGLKGEEIPLAARIMAVADTFDAMMSNRVYRSSIPLEDTLAEIQKHSGTQFDPMVVDAFLSVITKEKVKANGSYLQDSKQYSLVL